LIIAEGGEEIPASILAAVGGPAGQPARFTEELLVEELTRQPTAFAEGVEESPVAEGVEESPVAEGVEESLAWPAAEGVEELPTLQTLKLTTSLTTYLWIICPTLSQISAATSTSLQPVVHPVIITESWETTVPAAELRAKTMVDMLNAICVIWCLLQARTGTWYQWPYLISIVFIISNMVVDSDVRQGVTEVKTLNCVFIIFTSLAHHKTISYRRMQLFCSYYLGRGQSKFRSSRYLPDEP
jgi:hypothetical protein